MVDHIGVISRGLLNLKNDFIDLALRGIDLGCWLEIAPDGAVVNVGLGPGLAGSSSGVVIAIPTSVIRDSMVKSVSSTPEYFVDWFPYRDLRLNSRSVTLNAVDFFRRILDVSLGISVCYFHSLFPGPFLSLKPHYVPSPLLQTW